MIAIYIAAKVERNQTGEFQVNKLRRNSSAREAMENAAHEKGDVVALWDYTNTDISEQDAKSWISMVRPSSVHVRTAWGEFVPARETYEIEVVEFQV